MSELDGIRDKLNDTQALISRLEGDLAARPNDRTIHINLKSLQNRKRQLENELEEFISRTKAPPLPTPGPCVVSSAGNTKGR